MKPSTKSALLIWTMFNLIMLSVYLGFFYLCLILEFPWSLVMGWGVAGFLAGLCFWFRRLFLNRYEFLFYLVLPLDLMLESLIPEHTGYSFYGCAAAFWLVFVSYRFYLAVTQTSNARPETEIPDTVEQGAGTN